MILATTIRSYMNTAIIYGVAGDSVELVKSYGNVLIVENRSSVRFSVKAEQVSKEAIEHEKIETPITNKQPAKAQRKPKPAAQNQNELF